jgi:hypothetical protein
MPKSHDFGYTIGLALCGDFEDSRGRSEERSMSPQPNSRCEPSTDAEPTPTISIDTACGEPMVPLRVRDSPSIVAPAPFTWQDLPLRDALVSIRVRLGSAHSSSRHPQRPTVGQVVALDRAIDAPVEVVAGDDVIAYGRIVVMRDQIAVQITERCRAGQWKKSA